MRRRGFIGGALLATIAPGTWAQQATKFYRIGFLALTPGGT
jgi:hypothetical protein